MGWTDSIEERIDDAIRLLRSHGYRVIKPPKPKRELAGSVRIQDYDPETGALVEERYVDLRDKDGRPR